MTNSVIQLSNQIVLLEKHITKLEMSTMQLSNYIENSISHTEYINNLDSRMNIATFLIGLFASILVIFILVSAYKLFDNHNQQRKLEKKMEKKITNRVTSKFDELRESLSLYLVDASNSILNASLEINKNKIVHHEIENIRQEKGGDDGKEEK